MLNYNQELIVDSDVDRCGNYITVYYEFPFPEKSVLQERDKEMGSYMRRSPIFAIASNSDNCQKGK